ncbi:MAG: penicillin-binding protein 2 [Desulfobacterales bacterium]|nr:penicillin-binding protein 2 [Desulfobacterales bacterium]
MKSIKKNISLKKRISVVGWIFSFVFWLIIARILYLQVINRAFLSEKASAQYEKSFVLCGKRGSILDTNQNDLAVSVQLVSIAGYPAMIDDPGMAANQLSGVLGLKKQDLLKTLKSTKSFVWIKRQINPQEEKAVESLKLKGIGLLTEYSRFYPNTTLSAQVLGFCGLDGKGLEGLEFFYNSQLQETANRFTVIRDALGRKLNDDKKLQINYSGNHLILTIDKAIQFITESALAEAVKTFKAKAGAAVVMDIKTGELLAMANYPFFNPNTFSEYDRDRWRNRIVTDTFEPGSVMKVFVSAIALDKGYVKLTDTFFCENGNYRVYRNTIHDTHSYGKLTVPEIIKYSSNIGAVKIFEKMGAKALYEGYRRFGFAEKSGIDTSGETPGYLANYSKWKPIDGSTIAFGQGIAVTPLQLVSAVSAIANNGELMRPFLVKEIVNHKGETVQRVTPEKVRTVISKETAEKVKYMMRLVVEEGGTGVNAALDTIEVCGKTGTAQKVESGGYAKGKYISSFLGYAPYNDPKLAVLVVIYEPIGKYYAGTVAAPAFKKIVYDTMTYLEHQSPRKKQQTLAVSNQYGVFQR